MDEERLSTDERVQRSAGRAFVNIVLFAVVLGLLGLWVSWGFFTLQPGESAVILRFGEHSRTIMETGLQWRIPAPITTLEKVEFAKVRNEDFGFRGREDGETERGKLREASMQTSDNNIVRVPFTLQYRIKDPFAARYRVENLDLVVRDAAQAAMREVVGRMTVDGVLRERRAAVSAEVSDLLQDILDSYDSGIEVDSVQLQDVQPPAQVRAAFDDVVAATQDAIRARNEAEGYRNELLPKARAEATEIREEAMAYQEAVIAEATGQSQRFQALATEYRKAPEVTQKRLYLETMETVLPGVDKVIIEPGTTNVLPYLPLGQSGRGGKQP